MKIAMIAPLEIRVPPEAYGGIELVVSLITEALIRRGHDVTLFASGDSVTEARLVPGSERFLRNSDKSLEEKAALEKRNVMACLERASEFDIINLHLLSEGLALEKLFLCGSSRTPVLATLHGPHRELDGCERQLFLAYPGYYSTISLSTKQLLPEKEKFAGVTYNGIDFQSYPFNDGVREGYLLFLGSLTPNKAPHLAIEVARRLGRKLLLIGAVYEPAREYFQTKVEPEIDGDLIQYVGEVNEQQKRKLFTQADCLLAPIAWQEGFGMYFIEAMASGVPVVTFRRGSAQEVISHNETGFVVEPDNVVDMMVAVMNVPHINRAQCRRRVEERFSVDIMVDIYLEKYRHILE